MFLRQLRSPGDCALTPDAMTRVSSLSRDELKTRRKSLRRRRRVSISQALWRFWALSGLTAAIFWGATRPVWLLHSPNQINVTGNELLSDEMVQSLVPLSYPQPLMKVEPEVLARQLRDRAPITAVEVTRQLLPPRLNVHVQERVPVAVVLPVGKANSTDAQYLQAGFLDAHGAWMPLASFGLGTASPQLPTLQLRGIQPHYQRYWPQIYETIVGSPVAITEIDWHDPNNLVFETALGTVYLGPYSPELEQQLATLDKMRNLPDHLAESEVARIDLSNPDAPSIAVVDSADPTAGSAQTGSPTSP
ncbi:FtsQ-type POTRA domain-containing protein [Leptolyngbya sp. CCNP1308]|uniref:cell division protein FtsQ/DivIB n=1 Tax=Leptolyngbya sp. CCNP1308 TaxID=3110255 RepID=UPI002B1F6B93|nr:FtsQ-type POTRA domain-containing protein [Leptolyngbya sp. CCNP1308]MEA5450977.1 FtsQ-type POTRA domain-containing protein [Leptolyngbya sp. CCNP1308]